MERKYVCTRFKTLKDLSAVAVEGGIVNLNKLKQEDELHIYVSYRADLQTLEEFTLEF
jgi:hypothetical protein